MSSEHTSDILDFSEAEISDLSSWDYLDNDDLEWTCIIRDTEMGIFTQAVEPTQPLSVTAELID